MIPEEPMHLMIPEEEEPVATTQEGEQHTEGEEEREAKDVYHDSPSYGWLLSDRCHSFRNYI